VLPDAVFSPWIPKFGPAVVVEEMENSEIRTLAINRNVIRLAILDMDSTSRIEESCFDYFKPSRKQSPFMQ
jgi:hypothetical protein